MSVPAPRRSGIPLEIHGRPLDFSLFPTTVDAAGPRPAETVFAVSPWAVMRGAINSTLPEPERPEPTAFLQQAQDFYLIARDRLSANPLLYYYAFLNLAKALLRVRGLPDSLDHAHHGLMELSPEKGGGLTLQTARLKVRGASQRVQVFPALLERLGYGTLAGGTRLSVQQLLAQIVVGHRQWREAEHQDERFVRVEISFQHDQATRQVWLCLQIKEGDLARFQIPIERVLTDGRLAGLFEHVAPLGAGSHTLQQHKPLTYTADTLEVVQQLAERQRPVLWTVVSAIPGTGYRRHYLHLTPPPGERLPQIGSLWATLFYLGSIVRYRPHLFDELTAGPYGPFVTEFISAQPEHMLYMLASELCRREVAKPAIA